MFASGKPKTERADVWSYGVVALELYAETRAFEHLDECEIMGHVCGSFDNTPRGPSLEGISDEEIQAMCAACFAHDAKSRPSMALVLSFWQGCHSFN